jgi:hypothetical protein
MERLVERAKGKGAIRADLDQTDIIFMQVGLSPPIRPTAQ